MIFAMGKEGLDGRVVAAGNETDRLVVREQRSEAEHGSPMSDLRQFHYV